MSSKPEWSEFVVGEPSAEKSWVNPACAPLEVVYHIAHVSDAHRIFEDRTIRSSLVFDQSRLQTKRTQVCWVSPNDWWQGSIYGNVRFTFDWRKLIRRKRIYWVETLTTMRQRVVRLLITSYEFDDDPLEPYDATVGDGPLWHNTESDKWYCNLDGITNEYMVLQDLPIDAWEAATFVSHHKTLCSKNGAGCPQLNATFNKAGAPVMARLLAKDDRDVSHLFLDSNANALGDVHVRWALKFLRGSVLKLCERTRGRPIPPKLRKALIRAILMAYSYGQSDQARALANLFPNSEALGRAFYARVKAYFGGIKVDLS